MRDLVPDDPRIRLVHINEGYRIGQKRNFGVALANSELIAHWDDDDYSAPERLADQIERLQESGKAVTGYHSMLFTDGKFWWRYRGVANFNAMGTSLCYRKAYWQQYPFPALQIGEDGMFVDTARASGQFISVDAGVLMAATVHADNTSKRLLDGDPWTPQNDFTGIPGWP